MKSKRVCVPRGAASSVNVAGILRWRSFAATAIASSGVW
jgi:hypothetical protein